MIMDPTPTPVTPLSTAIAQRKSTIVPLRTLATDESGMSHRIIDYIHQISYAYLAVAAVHPRALEGHVDLV